MAGKKGSHWYGRTPLERIMSGVTKDSVTGCWNRRPGKNMKGYSYTLFEGRYVSAHRAVYQITHAIRLPSAIHLHHKCENRACCNPAHLQPTTPAEHNTHLSPKNPAFKHHHKTVCKNGHPLTGDNVRQRGRGGRWRECVTCAREASRRWYDKGDNAAKLARQRGEKRRAQTA